MDTSNKEAPEVLSSEDVFRGRVFTVSVDRVRERGREYEREVVRHAGSGVIIPLHDDGTVSLVRQYRHPAVKYLLEAPAGSRDPFEPPEECARRELEEELGLVAARLDLLSEFFVSPGFCAEKMWLYLATDLSETKASPEDDELLEVVRLPLRRALEMISTNEIEDAKTIIGLILAARHFNRDG
jgi:ADP-ribose pyrophosphatase